jgi:hypothetical protein
MRLPSIIASGTRAHEEGCSYLHASGSFLVRRKAWFSGFAGVAAVNAALPDPILRGFAGRSFGGRGRPVTKQARPISPTGAGRIEAFRPAAHPELENAAGDEGVCLVGLLRNCVRRDAQCCTDNELARVLPQMCRVINPLVATGERQRLRGLHSAGRQCGGQNRDGVRYRHKISHAWSPSIEPGASVPQAAFRPGFLQCFRQRRSMDSARMPLHRQEGTPVLVLQSRLAIVQMSRNEALVHR